MEALPFTGMKFAHQAASTPLFSARKVLPSTKALFLKDFTPNHRGDSEYHIGSKENFYLSPKANQNNSSLSPSEFAGTKIDSIRSPGIRNLGYLSASFI